jgi:hypothetical protein
MICLDGVGGNQGGHEKNELGAHEIARRSDCGTAWDADRYIFLKIAECKTGL